MKDKKDKKEKRKDLEKSEKEKSHSSKKNKHEETKKAPSSKEDKKRTRDEESGDEDLKKKAKKPELQLQTPSAEQPKQAPAPKQAEPPRPAPQSMFVIAPNLNTQAVKSQRHPNHWTKSLSADVLNELELQRVVMEGQSEHMEGGWKLIVRNELGKPVNWKSNTPILRVANATLHGVGLKGERGGDAGRTYKIKLEANMVDDKTRDLEIAKIEPQLESDQNAFTHGMDALTQKIGWLLFQVAKKAMIESMYERNLIKEIDKDPEKHQQFIDAQLEKMRIKKPWSELNERDKKSVITAFLPEYMKSEVATKEVFGDFLANMSTYIFPGDANYPRDEIPCFRQQTKVFYKPKKKESDKRFENEGSGSRKMPDKFSGQKSSSKSGKQEEFEDLKDGVDGNESNDEDSGFYDDYEDRRYDDLPDDRVARIRKKMKENGYIHRRFRYKNHDGSPKDLGQFYKDPNYRVVDQGDLVQTEFTIWVYSLSGQGRYGYKMQVGNNIWFIRKGIRRADVHITEESKLGRIEDLRPKELNFSAATHAEKTTKEQSSSSGSRAERVGAQDSDDDSQSESEHD